MLDGLATHPDQVEAIGDKIRIFLAFFGAFYLANSLGDARRTIDENDTSTRQVNELAHHMKPGQEGSGGLAVTYNPALEALAKTEARMARHSTRFSKLAIARPAS